MPQDKIFLTGAGGFIGSHLAELLIKNDFSVKAFVQYNSLNSWGWLDTLDKHVLDNIEVVMGDIRDPFGVKQAMISCQSVMHLAALIGIPYSYHSPKNYVETNITGTLNVVEAAKSLNLDKIIHTSTSEVYGTAQYVPIDEKHPLQGQSPYSATKIAADQIALSYYYAFQSPVTILRPFNTFGPRQSARAVIPTIITQINQGIKEIKLGSLEPTRDFTFVEDTAYAFLQAQKAQNTAGKIINLGVGYEISIGELARVISQLMGQETKIVKEELRLRPEKSEVERLLSDNSLAKRALDWHPQYVGLEGLKDGLTRTIQWFLDPQYQSFYKSRYSV